MPTDNITRAIVTREWAALIASRTIKSYPEALRMAQHHMEELELVLFPYEGQIVLKTEEPTP